MIAANSAMAASSTRRPFSAVAVVGSPRVPVSDIVLQISIIFTGLLNAGSGLRPIRSLQTWVDMS